MTKQKQKIPQNLQIFWRPPLQDTLLSVFVCPPRDDSSSELDNLIGQTSGRTQIEVSGGSPCGTTRFGIGQFLSDLRHHSDVKLKINILLFVNLNRKNTNIIIIYFGYFESYTRGLISSSKTIYLWCINYEYQGLWGVRLGLVRLG